jgi:hypothetical protein
MVRVIFIDNWFEDSSQPGDDYLLYKDKDCLEVSLNPPCWPTCDKVVQIIKGLNEVELSMK